jgi:hypothetical protein
MREMIRNVNDEMNYSKQQPKGQLGTPSEVWDIFSGCRMGREVVDEK